MTGSPSRPLHFGLLSTHPPTHCGLATFNAALCRQLVAQPGGASVVRALQRPERLVGRHVVAHLVQDDPGSAAAAARALDEHDVALVQHEYGIYGGRDGDDVVTVVEALTIPCIVVLHTVLEHPRPHQRWVLERLIDAADAVVTMTEAGRQRLIRQYDVDPTRAVVVPHGAHGPAEPSPTRRATGRPVILTWGLVGPGKGVEWAIEALASLRDLQPRYLVVGTTHPKVLERSGERYREGLVRKAARHEVLDLVEFEDRYVPVDELAGIVDGSSVVLLPYDSQDQVTSGVLVEAVAAGRPVVSTAFPHATELLADGLGLVVPQRDSAAMAASLRRVLTEPGLAEGMSARAEQAAPTLLWAAVAQQYRALGQDLVSRRLAGVT